MKAKNVLPFGQHSDKRTKTTYFLFTKHSEELYPLDVRIGKILWEIEMKSISKAKKKIEFSWTGYNNVIDENVVILYYSHAG